MNKEMLDAISELKAAQSMFDMASNLWRINEATYRIKAAEARIQAIRSERREAHDKEMDRPTKAQKAI